MQIAACPRPIDGLSPQAIVLWCTVMQMINELLAAVPIAALQVADIKTLQQDFGLIEPGSMCRRKQDAQPGTITRFQKCSGGSRGVTGAAIQNEVNASEGMKRLQQSRESPAQVFAVIPIQAAAAHFAVVDVE